MNEALVITPEQFGLEKKQAVTIEEAFLPKIAEREILATQYAELIKKDIDLETVEEAKILGRKLVKVRTGIADIHKKQKAFFWAGGKFVDAKKTMETEPILQMEEGTANIKNYFAKIEEEINAKVREERNAELAKYEIEYGAGDISQMDDDVWVHFVNGVKADYEAKKAAEKKAEEERIAKEKAEIEEQKRIRAENEKLKKEAELKRIADEKAEKERQRLAKIEQDKREAKEAKERAAHEAELKKEREAKERIQKELQAKADAERKAKEAEALRLKNEAEQARKAELAPDKDRLTKWVNDMTITDIVNDRMSKDSILIAGNVIEKFNAFKVWAKGEIDKIS